MILERILDLSKKNLISTYSLARGYFLYYFLSVLREKRIKLLQLEMLERPHGEDLKDVSLIYTLLDIEYKIYEYNKSTRSFELVDILVLN